ncbi:hypothetical protein FBD94_25635 [Pedobacter hiemivivus]|uniref:Uncharacterized protein n=1 Tax=Pedobacter hiemivivus TaxID=2530454 RepID=A0A4U1FVT6_9SPHI|nr:hypothetical protein [Pedobacter hiemivivus]TKC54977.1 hypothetical protein FBD94_25635 [Pedobacter hiemivivus]
MTVLACNLKIYLGLIDDFASVFFNGSLLDNSNSAKVAENKLDSTFIDLNDSSGGRNKRIYNSVLSVYSSYALFSSQWIYSI